MDSNKTVTTNFGRKLTIESPANGDGNVFINGVEIDEYPHTEVFDDGEEVLVEVEGSGQWNFRMWSNLGLSRKFKDELTIFMTEEKTLVPDFTDRPVYDFVVDEVLMPKGFDGYAHEQDVEVNGEIIDSSLRPLTMRLPEGEVEVRGFPSDGWLVGGWNGINFQPDSHSVTMDSDKIVTVNFDSPYEFTHELTSDITLQMVLDRGCIKVPKDVVMVLDHSGSMDAEQMSALREGCREVVDMLGPNDRLAFIPFATVPGENSGLIPFHYTTEVNKDDVFRPSIDDMVDGGFTPLYDAIALGAEYMSPDFAYYRDTGHTLSEYSLYEFTDNDLREEALPVLVIMTDGISNNDGEYYTHSPSTHGGRCEIAPNNDWFDTEKDYGYDNFDANEYGLLGMPYNVLAFALYVDTPDEVDDEFRLLADHADGGVYSGYYETNREEVISHVFTTFINNLDVEVNLEPSGDITAVQNEMLQFDAEVVNLRGDVVTTHHFAFIWKNTDMYGVFQEENVGSYEVQATCGGNDSNVTTVEVEEGEPDYKLTILSPEGTGDTNPSEGEYGFSEGRSVTVRAETEGMWSFKSWSGDVPEENIYDDEVELLMDRDRTIQATFEHKFPFELNALEPHNVMEVDRECLLEFMMGGHRLGTPSSVEVYKSREDEEDELIATFEGDDIFKIEVGHKVPIDIDDLPIGRELFLDINETFEDFSRGEIFKWYIVVNYEEEDESESDTRLYSVTPEFMFEVMENAI